MKKVYSPKNYYTPGFPSSDPNGFYAEISDENFDVYFQSGVVFEQDERYYTNAATLYKEPNEEPAANNSKGMFAIPGKSIKNITTAVFIIGCVISVLAGFGAGSAVDPFGGFNILSFLLTTVIGVFVSYVSCLVLAAIGDIAVNLRELNGKTK